MAGEKASIIRVVSLSSASIDISSALFTVSVKRLSSSVCYIPISIGRHFNHLIVGDGYDRNVT
jgi:hypothetical protein